MKMRKACCARFGLGEDIRSEEENRYRESGGGSPDVGRCEENCGVFAMEEYYGGTVGRRSSYRDVSTLRHSIYLPLLKALAAKENKASAEALGGLPWFGFTPFVTIRVKRGTN